MSYNKLYNWLAHCRVCGSAREHQSAKSKSLRFNFSRGLRIFSLSHTPDKVKKCLLWSPDVVSEDNIFRVR